MDGDQSGRGSQYFPQKLTRGIGCIQVWPPLNLKGGRYRPSSGRSCYDVPLFAPEG